MEEELVEIINAGVILSLTEDMSIADLQAFN